MRGPVVTVAVIVALGAPWAWALVRRWLHAALLTPLTAGLAAAAAAAASTVTRTPLAPWLAVVVTAGVALVVVRRRAGPVFAVPSVPGWAVALQVALVAPVAVMYRVPSATWDSRSIHWFRAKWFLAGGARAASALGEPAFEFAHPDYPPLPSATIAAVWRAAGGTPDPRVAQAVCLVLTISALVWVGIAVLWSVRPERPLLTVVTAVAGALVTPFMASWAAWGMANGYVDHLAAAALAAGAVLLLVHRRDDAGVLGVGALLVAVAMLTKNDVQPVGCLVVGLALLRHGRGSWRRPALWAPVVATAVWLVVGRLHGATSDLLGSQNPAVPTAEGRGLGRADTVLDAVGGKVGGLLAMTVVVALVGWFATGPERRRRGLGSDLWWWAIALAQPFVIVVVYLLTPYDLAWHLSTSLERTVLAPVLLLAVDLVVWACLAAASLDRARRPEPVADSVAAHEPSLPRS